MFRQRLRGGHKVGAPNNVTRSLRDQAHLSQHTGNVASPQSQFGASIQPPPQPGSTLHSRQSGQQQEQTGNNWGWGSDSSDGAWNWGDGDAWSWNTSQTTNQHQQLNQQQQSLLSQQLSQQPAQQYNQQHGCSQNVPHTSEQQFPKITQNVAYSNTHVSSTTSTFHQGHVPTNIPQQPQFHDQQYVNGDSQNGKGTDEWGTDNWGNDWGNTESYNNNTNKPTNYVKHENQQQQQEFHRYQQQQQQQQQQGDHQQVHQSYHHHQPQHHQEYHHHQLYFQPSLQKHEHQQQETHESCQQQLEDQYQHQPQQEQHQKYQQEYITRHHQPLHPQEHNQPQQQCSDKTQQYTEDDWSWSNDDWQVNGQTAEQHQENIDKLASQKPVESQEKNLQLTHISNDQPFPGKEETDNYSENSTVPKQVVNRDLPGDGWSKWEAEQLQIPEMYPELVQQNQISEEQATDYSAELKSFSYQTDETQEKQRQQWDDGWGDSENRNCVESVNTSPSGGFASQDGSTLGTNVSRNNTVSPSNIGLSYVKQDVLGQKSDETDFIKEMRDDYNGNEENQHFSEQQNVHKQQTLVPDNDTATSNTSFSSSDGCKIQTGVTESAVLNEPPKIQTGVTESTVLNEPLTSGLLNNMDDRWGDGWGEMEVPQNKSQTTEGTEKQDVQDCENYHDSEQVYSHEQTQQFVEFQLSDKKMDKVYSHEQTQQFVEFQLSDKKMDKVYSHEQTQQFVEFQLSDKKMDKVYSHEQTQQFVEFQLSDKKMDTAIAPVHFDSDEYSQNIDKHPPHDGEQSIYECEPVEDEPSEQKQYFDDVCDNGAVTKSEGQDEGDLQVLIPRSIETSQQATATESYTHTFPEYNKEFMTKSVDTLTPSDNPQETKEPLDYSLEPFTQEFPPKVPLSQQLSQQTQAKDSQVYSPSEKISLPDSGSHVQLRDELHTESPPQNYQVTTEPLYYPQTPQESYEQMEPTLQQELQFHYNSSHQAEHHQRAEQLPHKSESQNSQMSDITHPQSSSSPESKSAPLPLGEPEQPFQEGHLPPPSTDQPLDQHEGHLLTENSSYQQYQEINQEIVPEALNPVFVVSDPIFSRIPDGASSIPEVPSGVVGTAEDGSSHLLEDIHRPLVMSSSQEVTERPSSSQSVSTPSHPVRPPSSNTLPERPASNQSAHSVHSIHSVWSSQSALSTHSVSSQNQEVPLDENSEGHVPQPAIHQVSKKEEPAIEVLTISAASVTVGTDPTAPPANHSVGPPPVSGPLGAVRSLKARKGSPFQPPSTKHSPPTTAAVQTYQPQFFAPQTVVSNMPSVPLPVCTDVSANLETLPDNNEQPNAPEKTGVPLWSTSENVSLPIKLVVAAPFIDTLAPTQPPLASNTIPLVVPSMMEKKTEMDPPMNHQQAASAHPEPPAAHCANAQASVVNPKIQSLSSMPTNPTSPAVLDLSRSSRNKVEPRGDGSQETTDTPNFSRMVPGESSKGESVTVSTYQAPSVVPSMPSERVVTGNDNPQPVLPVRIKQEPSEVRSPPDGPYTCDLSSQGASVVPPVRSETIGSEEPTSRNFTSANSGSRSDLASDHRVERSGRWERDHSRDRDSRSSDRYRERSREHSRDYYRDRDDSPHSRRSYDRDYDRKYDDDRRRWRRDSDDEEDSERRYYESRDIRERAYRDELDRYSDRPMKEEKDRSHTRDKRRDFQDRSKEYYRSYDEDPYYGRGDRSQPVSRSSSINNLDNDAERSVHSQRSRRDYYDRHDHRDSHSRDSDPRDRDAPYTRDPRERDFFQRGWDTRDRRDTRYYNQRGGYEDAYGSREMYDQYQYYYHYYRDHPYYKEYYRQWMKQYGHAYQTESFYDDHTSIHSGRSSVNDELKKSVSSQFIQDFHGRSSAGAYEPSSIYPEGSFSQLKSYASGELSGVPSVADDTASEAPQRMTPVQFGRPHINAQFTFGGQLVLVLPKEPRDGEKAVVQLRDVQKMLRMDPALNRTIQQMKNYPGPLTLSETHKEVVVKYCEQQVAEAARNPDIPDQESVMLTWEYLALLVKQNGKLYGSDVAGLLLKGREATTQSQRKCMRVQPEDAPENLASDAGPQDEGTDMQPQTVPSTPNRDEAVLLQKFTEYLCLGRKREAVDYAVQEGLWGHALALSYKMDSATHTRVLGAFSSSIPPTDVLLTLFQQLSGKRPEITKSYSPRQWGDWRQHLAVMISNPTGNTLRDRASIVALGDTLASQGQLYAAHFCYLMAEVEWGSYSSKDSKLVLIGSSHHLPFQAFATNEAVQCTEVYEFARSLDSSNPLLETFQPYKLVYALRLTEYGFPAEALRYCEVISQLVSKTPASHQVDFLSQVYDLASRLKYHDLHYQMCQGEVSEMPDPQWLVDLKEIITLAHIAQTKSMQDNHQAQQNSQMVQDSCHGVTDVPDLNQQVPYSTQGFYTSSFITSQNSYNHNINDSGCNPYLQEQDIGRDAYCTADTMDGVHPNMFATSHSSDSQSPAEGRDAVLPGEPGTNDVMSPSKENTSIGGEDPMMQQPSQDQNPYICSDGYLPGYAHQEPNSSLYMQANTLEVTHSSLPPSSDLTGEQRPGSVTSLSQPSSTSNYQLYQSWDQQQHANTDAPGHVPSRSPECTESELSSQSHRTLEEEAYWAEMTGKKNVNNATDTSSKDKSDDSKKTDKDLDKSQDKSGGWSITSLFGWKKSKQAVLPDDKNPTIIWDEKKKKWVNQDGDEEVTAPPPPPPKSAVGGPGSSPLMMTRGGPKKSRYVNTEKDTSKGVAGGMPSNLPNPMLLPVPGASMNTNGPSVSPPLMVPASMQPLQEGRDTADTVPKQPQNAGYQEQHLLPLPQTAPVPAPLPEITQGMSNEGDGGAGLVPMMGQPIGQPQFFNPTQFKPSTTTNSNQTRRPGPGRRSLPAKR